MSTKKTDQTLQKCNELIDRLNELKKALSPNVSSNRTPANALGAGWSQDRGNGSFHHSTHGVVSTFKHPKGGFEIRHNGSTVGHAKNIGHAGQMIRDHVTSLGPVETANKAEEPYWSDASKRKQQRINREMDQAPRPAAQTTPPMPGGARGINPMKPTTLYNPNISGPKVTKEEMEKSNYGPKGAGLYDPKVNDSRKRNNLSEERVPGVGGPSASVKAYSSKPGQLSAKQQATAEAGKAKKLSGPVKHYTPAEVAALEEARKLKKTYEEAPWVQHGNVPNADQEVQLLQKRNPAVPGEDAMSTQLANMMHSRAMMRPDHSQPSSEDMIMAGQRMGFKTEEQLKAQDQNWGKSMNWLEEAVKPISDRFASEEEEMAYWSSIRVNDRGGGDYGF
jgi:hypothetical protein